MRTESEAAQLREELDKSLRRFRRHRIPRPFKGWICQIRDALGMTISELGHRMKVTASTVSSLQESERRGTIEIRTLKRVAGALDCHLFYALVPNRPLAQIVAGRRRLIASAEMAHACKGLSQPERLSMLPDWAKMIKRNRVWKDVPRMDTTKLIDEVRSALNMPQSAAARLADGNGSKAQAASKPTSEDLNAAQKRLDALDDIPFEKRTRDELKEWAELVLFMSENKEPPTPEEEARWKRLDELDRKGMSKMTREEIAEYEELLGPDDDEEEDDEENTDGAKEDADGESGGENDDTKEDEDEKKADDNDEDARDDSDEDDEEPKAPMTLAKVALVLGAGLKGGTQQEAKIGEASTQEAEPKGPRIIRL